VHRTSVCDCRKGWTGPGCEVAVSALPLDTPTTLVPGYNPDMKLTWDSSLNTPWSLLQLEVRCVHLMRSVMIAMMLLRLSSVVCSSVQPRTAGQCCCLHF
jgi:hypothetical protein